MRAGLMVRGRRHEADGGSGTVTWMKLKMMKMKQVFPEFHLFSQQNQLQLLSSENF